MSSTNSNSTPFYNMDLKMFRQMVLDGYSFVLHPSNNLTTMHIKCWTEEMTQKESPYIEIEWAGWNCYLHHLEFPMDDDVMIEKLFNFVSDPRTGFTLEKSGFSDAIEHLNDKINFETEKWGTPYSFVEYCLPNYAPVNFSYQGDIAAVIHSVGQFTTESDKYYHDEHYPEEYIDEFFDKMRDIKKDGGDEDDIPNIFTSEALEKYCVENDIELKKFRLSFKDFNKHVGYYGTCPTTHQFFSSRREMIGEMRKMIEEKLMNIRKTAEYRIDDRIDEKMDKMTDEEHDSLVESDGWGDWEKKIRDEMTQHMEKRLNEKTVWYRYCYK